MNIFKAVSALLKKEEKEESTRLTMQQKAWHYGYKAFEAGRDMSYCPYRKSGDLYSHWKTGWEFAQSIYEDLQAKK